MDKLAERTQLPAQPLAVATRIHFWQIEPNLRDPFNLASKPAGSIDRDTGRAYLLLNACGDARPRALAAHQILQGLRDLDPSIPIPMRHVPAFVACGLILAATGTTQCRAGSLRDDRARGRTGGRGRPRPRRGLSGASGGAGNGRGEPHVRLPPLGRGWYTPASSTHRHSGDCSGNSFDNHYFPRPVNIGQWPASMGM
jgi:hypothetical protein